jgi:hypothetical protein
MANIQFSIRFGGAGAFASFEAACIETGTCQRETTCTGHDNVTVVTLADPAAYPYGTLVEIKRQVGGDAATVWWVGALAAKERLPGALARWRMRIEPALIYWAKNTTYQQPYAYVEEVFPGDEEDPSTVSAHYEYRSSVMLMINSEPAGSDGTPIGTAVTTEDVEVLGSQIGTQAQINQILRYLKAVLPGYWAPWLTWSVTINRATPPVAMTDATCWECILQVLKWHPEALITSNPTSGALSIADKLSVVDESLPANTVMDSLARDRTDLVVPCVCVQFPITAEVDNEQHEFPPVKDIYPAESNHKQPGALNFTIQLRGPGVTHQKQRIRSEKIPAVATDTDNGWKWIQAHVPELAAAPRADFLIGQHCFKQFVKKPTTLAEGEEWPESFARELVEGMVPDWLNIDGKKACPTEVKLFLTYKGTTAKIREWFGLTGRREIAVHVTGTTLLSRVYAKPMGYQAGEVIPTGLAEAFYNILQDAQNSGTFKLAWLETGAAAALRAGQRLTDYGLIQRCVEDATTQQMDLEYGPFPRDLGPVEWMELQRQLTRTMHLSYGDPERRKETKLSDRGAIEGGVQAPIQARGHSPQALQTWFICQRNGVSAVWCTGGAVHYTRWGSGKPDSPGMEIRVPAGNVTVDGTGDNVWLKITYQMTQQVVELELEKDRVDLAWTGSATAGHALTWEGDLDLAIAITCEGGASGSVPPPPGECDCTCTAVWTGGVTGAVAGPIDVTVTGSISPSYFYNVSSVKAEVSIWTPETAELVAGAEFTNSETEVYILLAEILAAEAGEPANAWTVKPRHTGAVWAATPWQIREPGAVGGVGP